MRWYSLSCTLSCSSHQSAAQPCHFAISADLLEIVPGGLRRDHDVPAHIGGKVTDLGRGEHLAGDGDAEHAGLPVGLPVAVVQGVPFDLRGASLHVEEYVGIDPGGGELLVDELRLPHAGGGDAVDQPLAAYTLLMGLPVGDHPLVHQSFEVEGCMGTSDPGDHRDTVLGQIKRDVVFLSGLDGGELGQVQEYTLLHGHVPDCDCGHD